MTFKEELISEVAGLGVLLAFGPAEPMRTCSDGGLLLFLFPWWIARKVGIRRNSQVQIHWSWTEPGVLVRCM